MMPPRQENWGVVGGANTAPGMRPDTNPVYPQTGYQPSVPPQVVPPYAPPPSRSRVGWVLAFIGMGLFALIVFAVMWMARYGRRAITEINVQSPPAIAQPGETLLNESSADQVISNGVETTLVKTFNLEPDARFSLKNINGGIAVETWDQPRAEVKIIKPSSGRGGQVFFASDNGNLSIRTAPGRGEVRYEVKLPRVIGRLTLNSTHGSIKMTGVSSQIFVESQNGSIELKGVAGISKVQTTNGKISAELEEPSDGPMEFQAVNGSIDITVKSSFDADLEANTVRGSVNLDDQFGIPVQRELVGQRARGQIGQGGQLLKITTVNGSIRVAKQ